MPKIRKTIDEKTRAAWERGLGRLSAMIVEEAENLIPHPHLIAGEETRRVDKLWRKYTRAGAVFLSNGGVEEAFLSADEVTSPNATSFNLYRSDRVTSTTLDPEKIKQFMVEEGVVAADDIGEVSVAFALGSHEAFTRLNRCLHRDRKGGMLYPQGGYGLLVRAVATAEAGKREVHLVDADKERGDKISLASLGEEVRKHPAAKILYIECKTMCGAVYKPEELEEIVKFCKEKDIFMILDMAHMNMELQPEYKFPVITKICEAHDYKDYAAIVTASKTYGFERARVGFVVSGNEDVTTRMQEELYKTLGSMGDTSIDAAQALITSSPEDRQAFCAENIEKHRLNMNVLIAYIEGIDSPNIDPDLKGVVESLVPTEYEGGIDGLKLAYKPEGGIQLKVDTSGLNGKYFGNIRMFNSEILSYAIHAAVDVVTLHAFQIMDPGGNSLRLSFSILDDIHKGMQAIHDFINYGLSDELQENPFMPLVDSAETLIFPSKSEIEDVICASRFGIADIDSGQSLERYRSKVASTIPHYVKVLEEQLDSGVQGAASTIQEAWKGHRRKVDKSPSGSVQKPSEDEKTMKTTQLASGASAGRVLEPVH